MRSLLTIAAVLLLVLLLRALPLPTQQAARAYQEPSTTAFSGTPTVTPRSRPERERTPVVRTARPTNTLTPTITLTPSRTPTPSNTPTLTATPTGTRPTATATITPTATGTPTVSAATIPTPSGACNNDNVPSEPEQQGEVWLSNNAPARNTSITICARLILNGRVVSGATVTATVTYLDADQQPLSRVAVAMSSTDITGVSSGSLPVSGTVVQTSTSADIDVAIIYLGQKYFRDDSFTIN